MSLLNITIAVTGIITILTVLFIIGWVFYDLIKSLREEPSLSTALFFIAILCMFINAGCLIYANEKDKATKTEFQQYLDLKAKYEKEVE